MTDRINNPNEYPTTIGEDAVFKGELSFDQSVRLLGRFEGAIETKGNLMIAEGASLQGEVKAGDINVDGQIKGNLHATGKVRLSASANLEGDLHVNRLEVADGAVFIGRCVVGTNKQNLKPGSPTPGIGQPIARPPGAPNPAPGKDVGQPAMAK
jgi:cytoskeletal protein CcmA (bactofilin family)